MTRQKGSGQRTLFAPPEDFDKQLEDAYQRGRRAQNEPRETEDEE